MTVKSVPVSTQGVVTSLAVVSDKTNAVTVTSDSTQATSIGEAAVYEKTDAAATSAKTYTKDVKTLEEINRQVDAKLASLRATVENFVAMQSVKSGEAKGLSYDQIMQKYDGKLKEFYQNLQVDDETRLKAQQEISEDGFWGVKQTSERAIDYAKALAGGDPSKVELLKNSIEEGYKAAEKAWGGELPEICRQTQEATLKGLDAWAAEAAASAPQP